MSEPMYKIGDKFFEEEDKIINEILFVAPTVTEKGYWTYFLKVTSKDDPSWLNYDYTYEDFLESYCTKL